MGYSVEGKTFATLSEAKSYLNSRLATIQNGTYRPRCPEYSLLRSLIADLDNHSELVGSGVSTLTYSLEKNRHKIQINRRDGETRILKAKDLLKAASDAPSEAPAATPAPAASKNRISLPPPAMEEELLETKEQEQTSKKKKKKRSSSVRNIVDPDEAD
jgi:hypothetical protein